jgi:hypothetical protein
VHVLQSEGRFIESLGRSKRFCVDLFLTIAFVWCLVDLLWGMDDDFTGLTRIAERLNYTHPCTSNWTHPFAFFLQGNDKLKASFHSVDSCTISCKTNAELVLPLFGVARERRTDIGKHHQFCPRQGLGSSHIPQFPPPSQLSIPSIS